VWLLALWAVTICLLIRAALARRQERLDSFAAAWPLTWTGPQPLTVPTETGANAGRVPRPPVLDSRTPRPSSGPAPFRLSYFGLVSATVLLLLFPTLWLLQTWAHVIPRGLRIRLTKPGISAQRGPGIQPVLVSLKSGSFKRPRLYLDARPVLWEEFAGELQKELNRRPPDWPVYFEGDAELEWRWAVKAMDLMRGLQAEVVLLTPVRAENRG